MIWIIGAGNIGAEYAGILKALGEEFITIGRGEKSAAAFKDKTGFDVVTGGLTAFLDTKPEPPQGAIVAVKTDSLAPLTGELIDYGVKKILVEKPGVCRLSETKALTEKAVARGAKVLIAYNRRFYSSVLAAEKIIEADGGVSSFSFEFTEWGHVIEKLPYSADILSHWLMANSSHVIDTAFFLGGNPVELTSYQGGTGTLGWHQSGSVYAGAGRTDKGAMFSYQADWNAPGRWGIEILTPLHRLYLRPMEALQIQQKGSVAVAPVEIDDSLDKQFKPGFYLQTKSFVDDDLSRFCTLEEQNAHVDAYYRKISGYTD